MSSPVRVVVATSKESTAPPYFHLLWDSELKELRPILEVIAARRKEVLADWLYLYTFHFGRARALSDHDFLKIFGAELEATVRDLLAYNLEQFVNDTRKAGEQLASLRVPFAEVVVSMHLFEESATRAFPTDADAHLYHVFDKLSHIRIIALAQSYFGAFSALAATQNRGTRGAGPGDASRSSLLLPRDGRGQCGDAAALPARGGCRRGARHSAGRG